MKILTDNHVDVLKEKIAIGASWIEVVPNVLGGTLLDNGFWRIFGSNELGLFSLRDWNAPNVWKHAWGEFASLTFWGEDVFGNQILLDGEGKVFLWSHENAATVATGFDLVTILETCVKHGLGWIDFYSDGSYSIVKDRLSELSLQSHWHWIQPQIMGGQVTSKNLTCVERVQHMIGHGKLWLQIHGISHGSRIVPNS
jgi:hypothetical protein